MTSAARPGDPSLDERILQAAARTAREAGALLKAKQAMPRQIEEKGQADLVTDADRAAEELIAARLGAAFPGCRFLLEEAGDQTAPGDRFGQLRFVVDPLDGTTNYAAGIPHFAVSIGCVDGEELAAGAIYDPWRDELFVARRGAGARLISPHAPLSVPCRVSQTARLRDAVVATGFPYSRFEDPDDNQPEFCALNLSTRGCRRNGAATLDLAWVAAGRLDAYWERGLKPWDVAAGALIVEEAGGTTTSYVGDPCQVMTGEVVASNGRIHARLLKVLETAREAARDHSH